MKLYETKGNMTELSGNNMQVSLRINKIVNTRAKRIQLEKQMRGEEANMSEIYEELVEIGLRELEPKYGIQDFRMKLASGH